MLCDIDVHVHCTCITGTGNITIILYLYMYIYIVYWDQSIYTYLLFIIGSYYSRVHYTYSSSIYTYLLFIIGSYYSRVHYTYSSSSSYYSASTHGKGYLFLCCYRNWYVSFKYFHCLINLLLRVTLHCITSYIIHVSCNLDSLDSLALRNYLV